MLNQKFYDDSIKEFEQLAELSNYNDKQIRFVKKKIKELSDDHTHMRVSDFVDMCIDLFVA